MAKYAVPCVIFLLVAVIYNIVDQIFIANADYLGSYGNAANTVVFIVISISVGLAAGCIPTEKTGKLLLKFAIPCIFSLIISCLYNIVDQIFSA